jgi:hypothetical protein
MYRVAFHACKLLCNCFFVFCFFIQMLQFPAPFTDEATVSETATATTAIAIATATVSNEPPLPPLPLPLSFPRHFLHTRKLTKVPKVKKLFVPKPAPVLLPLSPSLQPSLPLPRQLKPKPKKLLDPDYVSTPLSGRKHGRDTSECIDFASVSLSPLSFDLVSSCSPQHERSTRKIRVNATKGKGKGKAKGNRRKHKTVLHKLFVGDSPASIAESIIVNDMSEATNVALLQMNMNHLFCSEAILLEDD